MHRGSPRTHHLARQIDFSYSLNVSVVLWPRPQDAGGRPHRTERYDQVRPPTCNPNAAIGTNLR